MNIPARRPAVPRFRAAFMTGVLGMLLLTACGGASTAPTATSRPANTTGITGVPAGSQNLDKVDTVFLRLLAVYQTQGLDATKQLARDQALMTPRDEVRMTLVLDSGASALVDAIALAITRLGGHIMATVGDHMEMLV
ncbi:MAG: hypothetical protein ACYDAR_14855, partial [Thermomicrobiales bacterium]